LAKHDFGIIDFFEENKWYSDYEPQKYNCISVDDNLLGEMIIKYNEELNLLELKEGMKVVDVGFGSGAITRKLSKWLGPKLQIIVIDRDPNFINYAKEKAAI
jgi:ubiquinone/menaquinone biosynthesis C-methylase UbiE